MIWLLAFFAALGGAALASESEALFGFLAGILVVVAFSMLRRQSRRLDALEKQLASAPARQGPVHAPEPEPEPRRSTINAAEVFEVSPGEASSPAMPPDAGTMDAATPTPTPAPAPSPAREPAHGNGVGARLRAFLFDGNVPVKIGLIVSLFGIGALIRYAASAGLLDIPLAWRYAGIAAAAIALLLYGLKQAAVRPAFGVSLQGGAIGILLLTVFGAYRVPDLLPAALAFGLVVLLAAGAAVLAIRQNAVWLAAIGFLGGYLAPLLLSTGSGNHIALFTWYALLNGAVFGMAWVRPWRALNLMGFVFTFGVGAVWGSQYFRPELFASTEPFLILFFLMFVAIPVLYALKGREPGKVDATLLFGTPLIAFPMQVGLLDGERLPLAFSALGVGAIYLLIALWSRREPRLRALAQSAAALGLVFATLAVPLALSARWTSATWALQGVALLWLGQVQARRWPQVAGVGLQLLAGIAYIASIDGGGGGDPLAVFNVHTLNLLLLAGSAGVCAWLLDRHHPAQRSPGGALMAVLATGWWVTAALREIVDNIGHTAFGYGAAWLGFVALSTVIAALLLRHVDWRKPAWWPALAMPSALLGVGVAVLEDPAWLGTLPGLSLLALAAALAFALPALRGLPVRLATAHIAGLAALCLALGLGIREALSVLNAGALGESWRWTLPWLPLAALAALLAHRPALAAWPVGDAVGGYRHLALGLAALALGTVWLLTLGHAGSAEPLPWIPLLNPLELFQLAGLAALAAGLRRARAHGLPRAPGVAALGLGAFAFGTMATLRACLHLGGEPTAMHGWGGAVDWLAVLQWPQTQAALSAVWALAGVVCWVLGSRRGNRPLWTCGALLLSLVLLKLLLVDRSNLGDLLGIVSFLVVGGLLVVVGRIAPRPPVADKDPA